MQVGIIVNTHGLRGEFKVSPWCDYPHIFESFSYVYLRGEKRTVSSVRYHKSSVILKLDGIDAIDQAESFKNEIITVDREQLDIGENAHFIVDLIGLNVYTGERRLGAVRDVLQTGANDVYVVQGEREWLIPVISRVIKKIDIENKRIDIELLDGMEDL